MRSLFDRITRKTVRVLLAGMLVALPGAQPWAAPYDLAEIPLFLGGVIEPNLVFTIDDSGSMAWSYAPDRIENDYDNNRGLAPGWNGLAYNYQSDYPAPLDGDSGSQLPNASFTGAWDDGYRHYQTGGSYTCTNRTVNLSTDYRPSWYYAENSGQYNCDSSNSTSFGGLVEYWGATPYNSTRPAGRHAFYYLHWWALPGWTGDTPPIAKNAACNATVPSGGDPDLNNDACYFQAQPRAGTGSYATDGYFAVKRSDRTWEQEQQNFANWYSYYRKRTMAAKAGVANAFSLLGTRFRIAFGRINAGSATVDGQSTGTILGPSGVRTFRGDDRDRFFDYLFDTEASGSTPLRRAVDNVGKYFLRADSRSPWVSGPDGSDSSTDASRCRRSYHIVMSDGYWNSDGASGDATGNEDNADGPSLTGRLPDLSNPTAMVNVSGGYTASDPFRDGWPTSSSSSTLADIAMYYWKNDLQPPIPGQPNSGIANEVRPVYGLTGSSYATSFASPNPAIKQARDPAFWQHLVTYTVGFGLDATGVDHIDPCCAFRAIANKPGDGCTTDVLAACPTAATDPISWPQPGSDSEYNLDDMMHAALNSRGGFLNARDPQGFQAGLLGILEGIVPEDSTAASVVLNSGVARTESLLYQALFTTDNWQGELRAFRIDPTDGSIIDANTATTAVVDPEWTTKTSGNIPNWNTGRKIATYCRGTCSGSTAVPFRWASLSVEQKTLIEAGRSGDSTSLLLNYLRGEQDCEDRNVSANASYCRYGSGQICGIDQSRWICRIFPQFPGCYVCSGSTYTPVSYRDRNSPQANYVLGDITNSAPAYVGTPNAPYSIFDPSYAAFQTAHSADGSTPTREAMLYVGANDGMLHAVKAGPSAAGGGSEVWAYVPSMVVKNLSLLSALNYSHRYYVDGSPTVGDWCSTYSTTNPTVCRAAADWRTALVAGLNAGGQGVYALNVTSATATTESDVASKVMWEFTDRNTAAPGNLPNGDPELGYTFSRPNIVRMNDGKWYAVFGNGYNSTARDDSDVDGDGTPACGADLTTSADDDAGDGPCTVSTTGNAVLFVVDLATGELVAKLNTGVGTAQDPLIQSRPNGLSTVAPIDLDGDVKADFIYGGDLFGNLWKFDVSSTDPNNWTVAYYDSGTGSYEPVFTARADSADATTAQPITTRPQVIRHPSGVGGVLVLFGTGKYFESTDNRATGQVTQSFYGIWDRPSQAPTSGTRIARSHLQSQTIDAEVSVTDQGGDTYSYRVTSDNPLYWFTGSSLPLDPDSTDPDVDSDGYVGWYLDLEYPAGTNNGERQVSDSILRGDKIVFTTLLPFTDECQFGGDGWLMELDASTGGRLSYTPFDVNGDGVFDVSDYVGSVDHDNDPDTPNIPVPASGRKSTVGIIPTPAILARDGGALETKYAAGSKGGRPESIAENPGPGDFGRQSWQQLYR